MYCAAKFMMRISVCNVSILLKKKMSPKQATQVTAVCSKQDGSVVEFAGLSPRNEG